MKKFGNNIFLVALLLSAILHAAAYCSLNFWAGRFPPHSVYQEKDSRTTLMQVGLINPVEPPPPEQSVLPVPDSPEVIESIPALSEIKIAREFEEVETPPDPELEKSPEESSPELYAPPSPAGKAGQAGLTAGPSFDEYLSMVRRRIEAAIYYPRRGRLSHLAGVVKVGFSIGEGGSLESSRIIESSQYSVFNRAALEILDKAAPFPEGKPEFLGREIVVTIDFKSTY
ncbi:MAG: energy transducer TonB [Candidatus Euphemobacter frigidus]|nr:energy transducer TonB [Candidatus Euphemobacter frigidus]MDP8276440.1 energy transducer TonB [Candidatus Euphemobacter frigidus]